MSVYQGEYADLYDLFYAEKGYDAEVAFTDAILREHAHGSSKRLLEVACGTGQHAIRFAAKGWDVAGLASVRARPASRSSSRTCAISTFQPRILTPRLACSTPWATR